MAYLSNSHLGADVTMRLEQRKSYTFSLQVRDPKQRKLDCTGCTFRFVMEQTSFPQSVVLDKQPATKDLENGFVTFNFQASELDLEPGEYPYALVALSPDGYSVVLTKGVVQIIHNPDSSATSSTFDEDRAIEGIEVILRGQDLISITVGNVLPPGMNFFSDKERETLNRLNEEIRLMKLQLGLS